MFSSNEGKVKGLVIAGFGGSVDCLMEETIGGGLTHCSELTSALAEGGAGKGGDGSPGGLGVELE